MTTLVLFFSLCALSAVLLALVVILPWLKKADNKGNQLMALNVQTFQARLLELQSDLNAGLIDKDTHKAQRILLQKQLLAAHDSIQPIRQTNLKSRAIVMLWIPFLMGLVYVLSNNRTPVFAFWQAREALWATADDLLTGKIDAPTQMAMQNPQALVSVMQQNVHQHAKDPERWLKLSQIFLNLEAVPQAKDALVRAYRLAPHDEHVAMTFAQTSFFANNGTLDAPALLAVQNVLTQNTHHEGAIMLMAMHQTRQNQYDEALFWVNKLHDIVSQKDGDHTQALQSLAQMRTVINAQKANALQGVRVHVSVADNLRARLKNSDILFVAIAPAGQTKMPLAAVRLPVSDVGKDGVTVMLSDNEALMPDRLLSEAKKQNSALAITARISHSGDAIAQSGDYMATPKVLTSTQNEADVIIDQIIP